MDRVAHRGSLARAPGAVKGGHFRNCQHFCRSCRGTLPKLSIFLSQLQGDSSEIVNIFVAVAGGPFGEKTNFRKNLNAGKLKGGPFGIFKHPICCKISKKLKGDPLGFLNTQCVVKYQRN